MQRVWPQKCANRRANFITVVVNKHADDAQHGLEDIVTDETKTSTQDQVSQQKTDTASSAPMERHGDTAPMPIQGEGSALPAKETKETDPLEEANKLASENRDRWLRAVAELENFKKRTAQERSRLLKYQHEELLKDLLIISDNLERAITHCDDKSASSGLMEGLRLVANMLKDLMAKYGVSAIESVGQPFDPSFHEAIGKVEDAGLAPNTVVEELEKGYMYHDRLLRPAKVTIAA